MADSLSVCVNGNAIAGFLEDGAEIKRWIAEDEIAMSVGEPQWKHRLKMWADKDLQAAKEIRKLVAEIDRLRQFEKADR